MKKISVYVPCFNSRKTISRCIESILNQTCPVNEVIVVDDGSTDDTLKIISKYPVKIIRHEKNRGLAAARNTAIKNSRNEFIASLDSDCYASPKWLGHLISDFNQKNVGGVGGRLVELNKKKIADLWRAQHMPQNWGGKKLLNPLFLYGNNSVFKKSVLKKVGLYNTKFRTNNEDVNISARVKKNYNLVYDPLAVVYHMKTDSVMSVLNNYWKWNVHSTKKSTSVLELKRQWGHNFAKTRLCISSDLKSKNYYLLLLSALLFSYLCLLDFLRYFKHELF